MTFKHCASADLKTAPLPVKVVHE